MATLRHHENWGFVRSRQANSPDRLYLSPTYDHASCLGRELLDDRRKVRSVESYAKKCISAFYLDVNDRKLLRTFELFKELANRYPTTAQVWLNRLAGISEENIDLDITSHSSRTYFFHSSKICTRYSDIQSKSAFIFTKIMKPDKLQTLFLAWQDYESRVWFPIGRLTFDEKKYQFVYIQGAKDAEQQCGFQPLISFPQWNKVYHSIHLFPIFAKRLMSRSRPEYKSFVERLNVPLEEDDPMVLLARSEGKRETDSLTVFPCPEPNEEGKYELHFFAHGLRYLPQDAIARIEQFQIGDKLWLAHEFQNEYDIRALTLNTQDHYIVGYCPRYLLSNVFNVLMRSPSLVDVQVERINHSPIPLRFRLLCKMTYSTLNGMQPFSQEEYQPITKL